MRITVTGASGFVGCNIAKVMADRHGDDVFAERIEMTDPAEVDTHVREHRPDAVVHAAIVNDWDRMTLDRHFAWSGFVDATRNYAVAAERAGIPFVFVSTDWVFDGTAGSYDESAVPNPVNFYGFLKAVGEVITREHGGLVARVSGVMGPHWARPRTPRSQDPGFGYFVASLVDALESGQRFTVWESPRINSRASPCLASMCGEVIRRAIETSGLAGETVHCCGSEAVTRRHLAIRACETFGLDGGLLDFAEPPEEALTGWHYPSDTSLSARWTSERLGTRLPTLDQLLEGFLHERSTGELANLP